MLGMYIHNSRPWRSLRHEIDMMKEIQKYDRSIVYRGTGEAPERKRRMREDGCGLKMSRVRGERGDE